MQGLPDTGHGWRRPARCWQATRTQDAPGRETSSLLPEHATAEGEWAQTVLPGNRRSVGAMSGPLGERTAPGVTGAVRLIGATARAHGLSRGSGSSARPLDPTSTTVRCSPYLFLDLECARGTLTSSVRVEWRRSAGAQAPLMKPRQRDALAQPAANALGGQEIVEDLGLRLGRGLDPRPGRGRRAHTR